MSAQIGPTPVSSSQNFQANSKKRKILARTRGKLDFKGRFLTTTKPLRMERVRGISSDLFDLDDYIKQYLLEHPDMPFATAVKIILRYYITPKLIVQLSEFKNYLKTVNFCLFQEVFGNIKRYKNIR